MAENNLGKAKTRLGTKHYEVGCKCELCSPSDCRPVNRSDHDAVHREEPRDLLKLLKCGVQLLRLASFGGESFFQVFASAKSSPLGLEYSHRGGTRIPERINEFLEKISIEGVHCGRAVQSND